MKIAKVIDLVIYANANTDIKLNRVVLYTYYNQLRSVNLNKFKYIKYQNLKDTCKKNKKDEDLQNWLIIFQEYRKAEKLKKKQEQEQKKFEKNLKNLITGFSMTNGFNPLRKIKN